MLLSIALIPILGMFMGWLCQKIKLPSLLGMLITGIVLGPYGLNLLDGSILGISADLRKNSTDHYSYKSRSGTGYIGVEKDWQTGSSYVFCAGIF